LAVRDNGAVRRTLVEFYDSEYLENIVSLLYGSYSDVVYVYFVRANEPTEENRRALHEYIRNTFGFTPQFLAIQENTVECALKAFRRLTDDGGNYDFDITGGSPVFIAAAGALAVGDGGQRIFLHEYDPAAGKRIFTYPGQLPPVGRGRAAQLTVDHVLALRGIEVLHPEREVRYRLNRDDLRGEVLRLWDTIRRELKAWNNFSTLPTHLERGSGCAYVEKQMTIRQRSQCDRLLTRLAQRGIISDLREEQLESRVHVSYRLNVPHGALFLYNKGGNMLEMLTYVAAVDSGCFADCCTGISLDWSDAVRRVSADPWNEIDTVLTRGHIPYFISCKNTEVENDFLYEIMVMARHYGGRYAVPALVCTTTCNAHLHARAKEMGVILIDDAASLSAEAFAEKLVSMLCGRA